MEESVVARLSAQQIKQTGKRAAAAYLSTDLASVTASAARAAAVGVDSVDPDVAQRTAQLDEFMQLILNHERRIDDSDNIEWCKWLIAGGRTPAEFAAIVRGYDNHTKCGLVWIPHVVAYRCRTCGISPCMSICRNCFKKGDHSTHDFNMFLSQAGGACDCGDTSVMKAEGFCSDHCLHADHDNEDDDRAAKNAVPPGDLLRMAESMMPRLLLRLLHHFRDNDGLQAYYGQAAKACDEYCSMLMELSNMGEVLRRVMTRSLIDSELYKRLVDGPFKDDEYGRYLGASKRKYDAALRSFPRPEPPEEFKHLPALGEKIQHGTLLEEFIFWTFKFEFPQNIVCFLLNMLPDQDYKEHLTRTFVMHYSRIPSVLEMSKDPDTLSNRVVHMSVQLFSNESLALKMVEELSLLHVMIISLKMMMSKNLIQNTLHDPAKNFHYVIDCAKRVMKEHCYWPLVSDFNNVLSHESVALVFLRDDNLVEMWFQFLSMLQGMNVNLRETGTHVEYEPSSYYAAFSCELEASAYPMWSIISHLKDVRHAELAKKMMLFCVRYLQDWLDAIYLYRPKLEKREMMRSSFHFPLHRYLAAFTYQAVRHMGMSLKDILPSADSLTLLMMHPLRVQSFFYEILSSVWIRNGLQIKGQAMTYIQANFCNSMVDMDLFFLQICATQLPAHTFLSTAIDVFGVADWLSLCPMSTGTASSHEMEQNAMLEGLLTFLATLVTSRTNLGNTEPTQCMIEIAALLATGDKTHSQLLELMPERSGNAHTRNFERFLKELSIFRRPNIGSENLDQGLFIPVADVWEKYYDPLHVLLRAVHRRDFQNSMDRYTNYVREENRLPKSGTLWPPFRIPDSVGFGYSDPACILHSRVLHSALLSILYRAVTLNNVSEHMIALAVFLLEMAVSTLDRTENMNTVLEEYPKRHPASRPHVDDQLDDAPEMLHCYPGDCLTENLRHRIARISLPPAEPQVSPAQYNTPTFDSDLEWDVSEADPMLMLDGRNAAAADGNDQAAAAGLQLAVPHDLSVVREQNLVRHQFPLSEDSDTNMDDDDEIMAAQSLPELTLGEEMQSVAEYSPTSPTPSEQAHYEISPAGSSTNGMEIAEIHRDLRIDTRNVASTTTDSSPGTPPREILPAPREILPAPSTDVSGSGSDSMLLPAFAMHLAAYTSSSSALSPLNNNNNHSADSARRSHHHHHHRHHHHHTLKKKSIDGAAAANRAEPIHFDESIISLLLKLHSQLSGSMDSFSLDPEHDMDVDQAEAGPSSAGTSAESAEVRDRSRIGDGPHFIGMLLRKIARLDRACAQSINEIRERTWPNQRERQAEQAASETREKEERSKRAKERQQKLMEEFAKKQKKFMETAAEGMECGETMFEGEAHPDQAAADECDVKPCEKEYVCIICNNTGASTEANPIGLVVLIESSGVLGHRRKPGERFALPLCDDDQLKPNRHVRLSSEFNRRTELLALKFGEESWFLSNNLAYESGVHVQSCGHHVHLNCHDSYLNSLYTSQRHQNLNVDRGEFSCPVCRQLSNSVLPLSPQLDRPTPLVKSTPPPFAEVAQELTQLIRDNQRPAPSTKLSEAMGRAMEDMTNSTYRKAKRVAPTFRNLFLFVTSIARTNLEAEIIQRGGSLCSTNSIRYKPKRDSIVPLLHILSVHLRVLIEWPLWRSWATLCGISVADNTPVPSHCRETVPSLLADPTALLLKYILLAPLQLDHVYFSCIVQIMYNLLYYQVAVQLCTSLTDAECSQLCDNYPDATTIAGPPSLGAAMAFILRHTNGCAHLRQPAVMDDATTGPLNLTAMEQQLQRLCLPFLRVAALLRHHLYATELPHVHSPQVEFVRLVYYLELVTESMAWDSFSAARGLRFVPGTEQQLPKFWCSQLIDVPPPNDSVRELVLNQHVAWQQPRLLSLPKEYERMFTYYHEQPCPVCKTVPKETSVCLLCGQIVCLKQRCCIEEDCCEAVRHTMTCGGGTGVFLVVTSTYIIVIRGRRACLWGSLYLDDFDEEDRDLKRGKPLYLNEDRFNLLESQWLSHRFAHTKHSWVFHRDSL